MGGLSVSIRTADADKQGAEAPVRLRAPEDGGRDAADLHVVVGDEDDQAGGLPRRLPKAANVAEATRLESAEDEGVIELDLVPLELGELPARDRAPHAADEVTSPEIRLLH